MHNEINSLSDLYQRLLPVLTTKVNELKLNGILYIKEKDIWEYQANKWSKSNNLMFSDMVSDILNTSNKLYEDFIKNKWKEN